MNLRAASLLIALSVGGCGPYALNGKAVAGNQPGIRFTDPDDASLLAPGIPNATYQLTLDPRSLNRKVIARGAAGYDGALSIPIHEPGAGFLEHEVELVVRHEGYDSAVSRFILPRRGTIVRVTLAPGPDRYRPPDDPLRDAEPYLKD